MANGTVGVAQAAPSDRLIDNDFLIVAGQSVYRQRVASFQPRLKTHVEFIPNSSAPTTIYTGTAVLGSADSAAVWTISKVVITSTTIDTTWTAEQAAIWNNRATESFS